MGAPAAIFKLWRKTPLFGINSLILCSKCSHSSNVLARSRISPLKSVSYRALHSSSIFNYPRFKLEVEREVEDSSKVKDGQVHPEAEEEVKNESYLKAHPYRKLNPWKSKSELAQYLVDNMIFDQYGLFVTNKPFGVGVRKPTGKMISSSQHIQQQQLHLRGLDISSYCLEELLPELRHLLKLPELVLCKSTERLTSGVAVFAEDEKVGAAFSKGIKASKGYYDITYKYHIVTCLTPVTVHPEKVEHVGVAIKTALETDRGQPVLVRGYSKNSLKRGDVEAIHVQTKPLRTGVNGLGCLVEVNTNGVHHNFLRVHCLDKLAPVLGDHLYSSRVRLIQGIPTKIDPTHLIPGTTHQLLSNKMQEALNLRRPEDSIMIPAHIHLRCYRVFKFPEKRMEVEFEAPYPPYFKWTCKSLGITLDPERGQ